MKDNFFPLLVSLLGKGFGIRGKGKDGEGEGDIPMKNLLSYMIFSPKVINHNGNLGPKRSLQCGWFRVDEGKLMSRSILNLYFQLEGVRYGGGLEGNRSAQD
jgi:hypothetical protein